MESITTADNATKTGRRILVVCMASQKDTGCLSQKNVSRAPWYMQRPTV